MPLGQKSLIQSGPTIRQGGRAVLGDLSNTTSDRANGKRTAPVKPTTFTIFQDTNDENSVLSRPSTSVAIASKNDIRRPLGEVKVHDENMVVGGTSPPQQKQQKVSDFWADKVAKLPFVVRGDSVSLSSNTLQSIPLTNYSDYRLDHSISSVPDDDDDDDNDNVENMVLDASCTDESTSTTIATTSKTEWRVPPVDYNALIEVSEYSLDILHYLKESETKLLPKWNYMTKQPDITFMMRSILVDWLVEVGEEYRLCNESLYLAVNYIDRFLSYMSVQRAKLQLVGTACMFIATKYEEIYYPDVSEFTYITDDNYSKKQVLRMEHLVLKVLGFDLTVPTAYFFVNQFAKLSNSPEEVLFLAQYLSELTLLDAERYLCYTPSIIGASAVTLARHTCQVTAWPEEMVRLSGYNVEHFQSCLVSLHQTFTDASKSVQQAMREKYRQDKYHRVSELTPAPISSSS